jgi:carboxynorspermidine decarboxylase
VPRHPNGRAALGDASVTLPRSRPAPALLDDTLMATTLPPTPYFLLDERRLARNLEVVRLVRERSGAKSVLALKCFATWGVFGLMREYLDGTTSSSPLELRLGREEFGGEAHVYSVAFTADELADLSVLADKVIFNSVSQLERLAAHVRGPELGLRVNPGVSHSHFDLADPARRHSRLGVIDLAALRAAAPRVQGLMFHFNCENDDIDDLAATVEHISDRYADVLATMSWVSLGGGIAFTSPGYPVERFCELLRRFSERFGVQVYLEPGEACVTSSAELVTTVLDVVHNEVDVAIVDASVEAHVPDHLIYGTSPSVSLPPGDHRTIIAGRTCLAGDVFGDYRLAATPAIGDEVRFEDAAGYSMVKTSWFNGLAKPSIAIRRLDGSVDVVRRFGYEDFRSSLGSDPCEEKE